MRRLVLGLIAAAALAACSDLALPQFEVVGQGRSDAIRAAVADPARPPADVKRDPDRKPVDMLIFAGVKPGDKVADFVAGGGYFTRLFAKTVGPKGRVYAIQPAEIIKIAPVYLKQIQAVAKDYDNVVLITEPLPQALHTPEKLDLVWTSQNYHDLHDPFMGPADMTAVNKAIYDALKPGGHYVVLDHVAAAGSGFSATNTLHRVDPEAVKKEVEAAGFVLESESKLLRNPNDPHTANVFDPSIRGHTDQFIFKFRKPKS
jgi:predicted methyltransferase